MYAKKLLLEDIIFEINKKEKKAKVKKSQVLSKKDNPTNPYWQGLNKKRKKSLLMVKR